MAVVRRTQFNKQTSHRGSQAPLPPLSPLRALEIGPGPCIAADRPALQLDPCALCGEGRQEVEETLEAGTTKVNLAHGVSAITHDRLALPC